MLDVSKVLFGAESDGASTPTSLGLGVSQRHFREYGVWDDGCLKNEERTMLNMAKMLPGFSPGWSFLLAKRGCF